MKKITKTLIDQWLTMDHVFYTKDKWAEKPMAEVKYNLDKTGESFGLSKKELINTIYEKVNS